MDSTESFIDRSVNLAFPWDERMHHVWFAQREMCRLASLYLPVPWGSDWGLSFGPKAGAKGLQLVRLFQIYVYMFGMLWFRPSDKGLNYKVELGFVSRAENLNNYTHASNIASLFNGLTFDISRPYFKHLGGLSKRYPGSYLLQVHHRRQDILYLAALFRGFATLQKTDDTGTNFYVLLNIDEYEMLEDTRRPLEDHEVGYIYDKYASSGMSWVVEKNERDIPWI